MMEMELGKINLVLSKSDGIYAPGDHLEGRLEIDLPAPKKIKSVYIKINGSGGVRFQNLIVISNTGKTQNVLSFADENYIQHKHQCLKNSGNTGTLASGKHVYPFFYHLPFDLPSSFQHEYGTIKYFLKAVLELTRGMKQRSFKDFFIKSYLNLNLYPNLQDSHIVSVIKKSSFLWMDKLKAKVNVKIPKTGYVVGETIFIEIDVINLSDKVIADVVFELKKTVQFNAHAPKKDLKIIATTLAKTNLGSQPARCAQNLNHHIIIPDFPHEALGGSKIINIKYNLEVTLLFGLKERIVEKIPLSIGVWQNESYFLI